MLLPLPQRIPCPFCENIAGRHPCAFIVQDQIIASFVNPRQYGKGGVLIIPIRHASTIFDLTQDELHAISDHTQRLAQAIHQAYHPSGYNIFQNNGRTAGQSVPHYHLHIVPRYDDDAPNQVFGEQLVEKTPMEQRLIMADTIRSYLMNDKS